MTSSRLFRSAITLLFTLVLGLGADVSAQTQYERFAGRLMDLSGTPQVGTVSINGYKKVTAQDGTFEVYAPYSTRYVIQATKLGYVPLSIIHTGEALDAMELKLAKAETFTIDAAKPLDVTDSRGTRIAIPAGSLVDAQGLAPTGPIQLNLRTYDLRNEQMVGDMSAIDSSGQRVMLSSIGAFSAEFTDSSGKYFNLRNGSKASITLKVDPGNTFTGAVPLWWYDTARGLWVEEGMGNVVNGVATGQVGHFSVWNFDVKSVNPACIKLTVDPAYLFTFPTPGGKLQVKVTVPSPWYRVSTMTVTTPGPHALYNLPPNANVEFEIGGQPYALVNTGNAWGGTGTPAYPYSSCNGSLHVNATPQVAKVLGKVLRQYRTNHGGVTVTVKNGTTTVGTASTDASGSFSLQVFPGTVSAKATRAGYLYAEKSNVAVAAGGTVTLPTVTLPAGDMDDNGCITWANDLMVIGNAIGMAASATDPRDINGDASINYLDLNLASANGGLCSPAAVPW
jgi:hypothetical protein